MEFKIEKLQNYTLIQVLEEKLDTHIAPTLKSELVLVSGNGEKNIVLDLSKCRYCDSSGLSAILVANRLCKNANGTFVLTGLNDAVERLITISQLDTVLNIAGSVDEAVKLFAEACKLVYSAQMSFALTVLGSSSAIPTSKRFPTAQVLNVHERFFLIDCGEGTQIQLRRFSINMSRINHIFISHLHGDHVFGLIWTIFIL